MEKKAINNQVEKLKESIEAVSLKSKDTIKNIITTSSRQFEATLDANKKFIESLEKQFFTKDFTDGSSIVSEVKRNYGSSVELSEEAIDTIIDIQSTQVKSSIDFNLRLAEAIKDTDFADKETREELLDAIWENFEKSSSELIENTRKIADIYNKHINLAVNFNEKFYKNINMQLEALNKVQGRNMDMFNEWASHWWKSAREEAVV
jgi:hypothetical protein